MSRFEDLALPELAVRRMEGLLRPIVPAGGHPRSSHFRRLFADPAFENLGNNRPVRVVWVCEVHPVGKLDRPALIMHLVNEVSVPGGDPERSDARDEVDVC